MLEKSLPERALIIDEPWISMILAGEKDWEMRSRATRIRGPIALIRKGSGLVVGVTELTDCMPALDLEGMQANIHHHGIPAGRLEELARWRHPWVLVNTIALDAPVHYTHPRGAVTWVRLSG